jgi:hypothetical protein
MFKWVGLLRAVYELIPSDIGVRLNKYKHAYNVVKCIQTSTQQIITNNNRTVFNALVTVIHVFPIFHINYRNCLLYDVSNSNIGRLQQTQGETARNN